MLLTLLQSVSQVSSEMNILFYIYNAIYIAKRIITLLEKYISSWLNRWNENCIFSCNV